MSRLIAALEEKQTKIRTENGMKTYNSSLSACVDLFFMAGGYRKRSDNEIINLFMKAYNEHKEIAIKLLAYIRDPRGGMGERRFFRVVFKYLCSQGIELNFEAIPEIGRWDDLFEGIDTNFKNEILKTLSKNFDENLDIKNRGLFAKWMPRKGKIAGLLAKYADFDSMRSYRKQLVYLTNVVETQMCNNEWKGIKYKGVPSVANIKYNAAFLRHDTERRRQFLADAAAGKVKINSAVNFPHSIVKMVFNGSTGNIRQGEPLAKNVKFDNAAIALWKNLPDYLQKSKRRLLPMSDTSGSMTGEPLLISVALALYLSERNEGLFKDAFLTFTQKPTLHYVKGNLCERLASMNAYHPANTNLEAAFDLILKTAVKNRLPENEMPTDIVIISDMEFDQACRKDQRALKMIKGQYKDAGYTMPNIVFWNVNSRQNNVPVRFNEDGVALVSGASPAAIKAVLSGEVNPLDVMLRAIDQPKYEALNTNY